MDLNVSDLILLVSLSAATARKKLIIRNPKPEMIPKTKNIKDQKLTCASRSPTLEKTARISAKMMAKATWGDGVEDDEEKNRWRRRTKRRKEWK